MEAAGRRPWGVLFLGALLAAVGLRLLVLGHGLAVDDFAQAAMVEGAYPVHRACWDLYRFSSGAAEEVARLRRVGQLAWWSDDHLRFAAFRPLGSLLRCAELRWLGPQATAVAHAHSLLWWGALLWVYARAVRRHWGPGAAALAVLLYAFEEGHGVALSWIANRPALVSALFVAAAMGAYLDPASRGRDLRVAGATALALAAGEYGVCVAAFALGAELARPARDGAARLRRFLPVLVPTLGYLLLHRLLGYGARGSGVYADPGSDPWTFVEAVAVRLPVLLADAVLGLGADAVAVAPNLALTRGVLGWVGAAALVGTLLWLAPDRRARRAVAGGTAAALLALVPMCGAFASARLLVVPGLAIHLGIAHVLVWSAHRAPRCGGRRRAVVVGLAVYVGGVHLARAAFRGYVETEGYHRAGAAIVAAVRGSAVRGFHGRHVVVVAARDPTTLLYGRFVMAGSGVVPRSWLVLSAAPAPVVLRGTGDGRYEVRVRGPVFRSPLERLFRAAPVPPGRSVTTATGTVTAVAAGAHGGRFLLELTEAARNEGVTFAVVTRNGLRTIDPPRPGASLSLPAPPVPMRLPPAGR